MNNIPGWGFISVPVPFPFAGSTAAAGQPDAAAFQAATQQQPAAGGDFLGGVHSAQTSGEKRDLIDAFAAGFIAASRGSQAAPQPAPSYVSSAPTNGLPSLPVGQSGPVAGVPTLAGIEQSRREAFAGVMEGFQHFAGLIEESAIPEQTKNQMLDGLAGLMSQFAGLANIGANNGNGQLPQLPPPNLPGSGGSLPGSGSAAPSDVWTHEKKDDGTAQIRLGDKYTIDLKEGDQSFTIRNNQTGAETRVWGDPHVDKNGDGKNDFDFKKDMTFQLEDGTKITVNTVPGGSKGRTYSSELTITNGNNAIQVKGLAGNKDGANNLEILQSNTGATLDALTADGAQVIYERGNDWVGANGQSINQAAIDAAEQHYA